MGISVDIIHPYYIEMLPCGQRIDDALIVKFILVSSQGSLRQYSDGFFAGFRLLSSGCARITGFGT